MRNIERLIRNEDDMLSDLLGSVRSCNACPASLYCRDRNIDCVDVFREWAEQGEDE